MAHTKRTSLTQNDEHAPNVALYIKVFAALLVLTGITVVVSKFHLPRPQAVALGLLIAITKAGLVAAIFMHLWGESKLIYKILGTVGLIALLLILPLLDFAGIMHKMPSRVDVAAQHPNEK